MTAANIQAAASQSLRHLPGLPQNVPVVPTVAFRKAQHVAALAIRDREIATFTGDAGLGKTFAVDHATRTCGEPWVWVQIGPAPRPKEVTSRLLKALLGSFQKGTLYELTDQLIEELADTPHIVVIDEAQNLDKDGLDQIRLIHDATPGGFPLFFVGGASCADTISSDPQLKDRVGGWCRFEPITGAELFTVLDTYHPFLAATDRHVIAELDRDRKSVV